jgi:hypothetical protein
MVQDVSAQVLDVFNKRPRVMLLKVDEIVDFLEQPLPNNMKIPILRYEYNSYLVQGMEMRVHQKTSTSYEFITKTLGATIHLRARELSIPSSRFGISTSDFLWNNLFPMVFPSKTPLRR